jgi:hypothetical protein
VELEGAREREGRQNRQQDRRRHQPPRKALAVDQGRRLAVRLVSAVRGFRAVVVDPGSFGSDTDGVSRRSSGSQARWNRRRTAVEGRLPGGP